MPEKTAKYTGQDTVFRDMFSQKKYLLQLYRALHPEDTNIKATDFEYCYFADDFTKWYLQRSGLYGAWR